MLYGPHLGRTYSVVEFMHNPLPQVVTPQGQAPQNPALQGSQPGADSAGRCAGGLNVRAPENRDSGPLLVQVQGEG